jgi:hypothetical protein
MHTGRAKALLAAELLMTTNTTPQQQAQHKPSYIITAYMHKAWEGGCKPAYLLAVMTTDKDIA